MKPWAMELRPTTIWRPILNLMNRTPALFLLALRHSFSIDHPDLFLTLNPERIFLYPILTELRIFGRSSIRRFSLRRFWCLRAPCFSHHALMIRLAHSTRVGLIP